MRFGYEYEKDYGYRYETKDLGGRGGRARNESRGWRGIMAERVRHRWIFC